MNRIPDLYGIMVSDTGLVVSSGMYGLSGQKLFETCLPQL